MKDAFIVQGGKPLAGSVCISGAKNVALKVVIASLLFDEDVELTNIPRIKDVEELVNLVNLLGVKARFTKSNTLRISSSNLSKNKVDFVRGSKIRTSFMLFAPLLYRFGKAEIPNPGGCRIGERPIDRQVEMMKAYGIDISYNSETGYYCAKLEGKKPKACCFTFEKPTHTGTELAILFAILADGETAIENASCEPEIDNLISFLTDSGAKIERKGNKVIVKGKSTLKQKRPFRIMGDRNEAVTYAVFALGTKGNIEVKGAKDANLKIFLKVLNQAGGGYKKTSAGLRFFFKKELKPTSIKTAVHPYFMTDWQAPWAVLMTQARGKSTIHETVFEDRFGYVKELKKLGAKIVFFQPEVANLAELYQFNTKDFRKKKLMQGIKIFGKTKLHNGVLNVSDLRAGATVLIASTVAEGKSVVNGASVIDRGYEKIVQKLQGLGADIKRV